MTDYKAVYDIITGPYIDPNNADNARKIILFQLRVVITFGPVLPLSSVK